MNDITIITPWLDHPEFIADYEQAVNSPGAEVIVIDNGSATSNAQLLRAMVDRLNGKYIRNEENRWFSAANNQGLKIATGRIILFVNNDISATAGWLDPIRRDVTDAGLFGPTIRQERVDQLSIDYIEGSCIAALREIWNRLGEWNERAFRMNHCEDVELCIRAVRAGLSLNKTDWAFVHKGNGTGHTVPANAAGAAHNRRVLAAIVRGEAPICAPDAPNSAAPALQLQAYLKNGRLPDAERDFREALQREPRRADLWMDFGAVLRAAGRFEAAADAFTQAMRLDPRLELRAFTEIGAACSAAERHAPAIEAFMQVVLRRPDSPPALCNLSGALHRAGQNARAKQAAREALRVDPSCALAHLKLANVLISENRPQDAIAAAKDAIRLNQNDASAWCVLAEAHRALGNPGEMLAAYDRALEIDPDNVAIQHIRAALKK
ncbi:MAG TPA: tetratricopeptide repeat protein [Humisphaera sp.]|nr:tetratricopeptide repeat protein [Humisphaera sp.]